MGNRSTRYTEEFKRDAVALVRSSGRTVNEVARELGVSSEGLRNWVTQDKIDRGEGQPGELTSQERDELRRLRREVTELRTEKEILKKVAMTAGSRSPGRYENLPVAVRADVGAA